MKLYRKMNADADGRPVVGTGPNMLGVRPRDPANPNRMSDVSAALDGDTVQPGKGLSAYDDAGVIPPKVSGVMWSIETDELPAGLTVVQRGKNAAHYHVEPNRDMTLGQLQGLLESTRELWDREPEGTDT